MESRLDAMSWSIACRHLTAADPDMARLVHRWPGESLEPHGDVFRTLARAITGQQISVVAAERIWSRLVAATSGMTAPAALRVGEEALARCGLTRRKARALHAIAAAFCGPDAPPIARQDLLALPCVGPWTADMVAIFALGEPDILPVGDIGLLRAVERRRSLPPRSLDAAGLERIAARWRPWRSVAVWHLWRELDPVPVIY